MAAERKRKGLLLAADDLAKGDLFLPVLELILDDPRRIGDRILGTYGAARLDRWTAH